ncbi:MAG: alpha-xylosidase [Caldilinea sp.]|nr:alpha-xylosidase [Caldilinea sp.]MDW8441114.1 alpha-xylosidase [Caldilineaceae bacterium]
MKFTAGYWDMRPGITLFHPMQVLEVETDAAGMTVYALTKRVRHRFETINLPMLTLRFTSPLPNVVRVQVVHHKGRRMRTPHFQLFTQSPAITIENYEEAATLTSGKLSVRVSKGERWRIDFMDGDKVITSSADRAMGFVDAPEGRFMLEQLNLSVGECVYGLGERFTPFVKNGQVIDLWHEDGGTSSELAYKNIPFYLTNRGYGVFVNHPELVSFEVGSEKVNRVQFSTPGEQLDYFLIYGPTLKEVLERYTALTGRPALPPAWSFGLWLSTSFTTSYDEETVTTFIQGMADRDIPLHVFHFDCFWMKEFQWVDFEWDRRLFSDPEAMVHRLKERGLHICVWINPYVAQKSPMFDEGMERGYLLKRPDGDVWQWDRWQAGMGLVDFTNPDARRWYTDKLRRLLDMGVDCFKTDFGERIPTDVVYHDGSDPIKMHNYYTYLYNETVFRLLEEIHGQGNAIVFARSATAGCQQFPVHWGGDNTASFESMAETLRGGLSLSMCGFGFWSHDISGFEKTAPPAVYKRWCAFGLLSSHSRLHGNESYRVPWHFDEEAVDVLRFFTKLKCRLMPYLYEAARQAHLQGIPIMRPMILEFSDDPASATLDRQYMLGESLLVAPVFTYDGSVEYYLPAGQWTHFFTGKVTEGGRWRREQHDFFSLPLLVRPNTALVIGEREDRPDYAYHIGFTLRLYQIEDGATIKTVIPTLQGETAVTFTVQRRKNVITISWEGEPRLWRILLVGIGALIAATGGSVQVAAEGAYVTPEDDAATVQITLTRT